MQLVQKTWLLKLVLPKQLGFFTDMHLQGLIPEITDFIQWWEQQTVGGDLFEMLQEAYDLKSSELTNGSQRMVKLGIETFREFRSEINYLDLNEKLIKQYHHWLIVHKGIKQNTRANYMATLQALFNEVRKKHENLPDPFEDFSVKHVKVKRNSLTRAELIELWNLYFDASLNDLERNALEVYLLCCFTGLRIFDAVEITLKMFVSKSDAIL